MDWMASNTDRPNSHTIMSHMLIEYAIIIIIVIIIIIIIIFMSPNRVWKNVLNC